MIGRAMQLSLWLLVGVLHAGVAVAQASAAASKRTYWLEGGVIGAVVLGVASFLAYDALANSACSDTGGAGCKGSQGLATLGGAGLGFLIGALIGKGHTKAEPSAGSAPD